MWQSAPCLPPSVLCHYHSLYQVAAFGLSHPRNSEQVAFLPLKAGEAASRETRGHWMFPPCPTPPSILFTKHTPLPLSLSRSFFFAGAVSFRETVPIYTWRTARNLTCTNLQGPLEKDILT